MTIPSQNTADIREIVRETLPEDARPDFRPQNRWYVVDLDREYQGWEDALKDELRAAGYKVSVVGSSVKVTKPGVDWSTVD